MTEYKEPTQGHTKIYTHEIFFCIDKKGKILKFRLSFDEDVLFVRSAHILKLDTDFAGEACYKAVPIKDIKVSDRAMEAYFGSQELNMA